MGNSNSNGNRRDYDKNWSPYGDDFGAFGRKKSKRWSLKKSKGIYKTVSELDIERGLPSHLRYQSPNSVEEDLFTIDTRSPCVIHLHQRTRQDINHILRGSSAYAKAQRPKSFDARLLLDASNPSEEGVFSPQSPRNSSFMSSSTQINTKVRSDLETSQNSSERSMRIDSSTGQGDIVKVDTSGTNFDRQASLRRSHRLSSSGVRQRANAAQRRQQRHKHRTLTALPGNISSELGETPLRPYSVYSHSTNNSASEAKSLNGQVSTVTSPKHVHLRNVEIQTDDVRVIPLTPAQKRMRQKVFSSNNSSPTNSQGSAKYLESPTTVSCQTPAMMKQTSTPINDVFEKELIRPSSLDVKNNDTSTDEGRHTGESSPPTPVRTGTPQELMASPQLKKSQNSPVAAVNANAGNYADQPANVALRIDGGRLNQGEDRASSGCWSGTESVQHSSSSDITMQHAPIVSALQQILKNGRVSPKYANSGGKVSPIVDNRPLVVSSAVSSSTVSINSKLSKLDVDTSNSSLNRDSDDRLDSPASSVISVTINRSHHASNASLTSGDGGRAISAAAMAKKTRKARLNGIGGEYNFMNYECDPLEIDTIETRVVKNRRSTRSTKRNKKYLAAEDTISLSSMADSSPRHTEAETMSAYSGGKVAADAASLSGSTYSGDQEERSSPLRSEKSYAKGSKPHTPVGDMPDTVFPQTTPTATTQDNEQKQSCDGNYDSYHRAIKSNHATPKSLLTSRQKSASVKVPKHLSQPAIDFQSELNRRLSVRPVADKKLKKSKRGAPPPPPKRASSLSNSCCPSPSLSLRSENLPSRSFNTPSPKHTMSVEDYYRTTPPPKTPTVTPAATPSPSKKIISPLMAAPNSLLIPPATAPLSRKAIVPIVTSSMNASPAGRNMTPFEEFYRNTPPPPPPTDQLPPPPPELLTPIEEIQPPVPVATPGENSQPKTPTSPKTPSELSSPMQSIAMQAALLGSRMSQKKKRNGSVGQDDADKDVVTSQNINQSKDSSDHSKSSVQSPKIQSDTPTPTHPNTTSPTQITKTTNETSSKVYSFNNEIIRQKSKLKSRPSGFKLQTTTTEENSSTSNSPEPKPSVVPTSPAEKHGKSPSPSEKSPPPVAIKGFLVPKNKTPPPTSSKPPISSKPPVSTKPPPVSQKPKFRDDFGDKRTREQSPTYRASIARAAFFANISPSQSETDKPATKSETDKLTKVPLVAASPTETPEASSKEDDRIGPNDSKTAVPKLDDSKTLKNPTETPESVLDDAKSSATIVNHEINGSEEHSNTWMEELEDLSPSIKETARSESATSKLSTSKSTTSPRYSNYDNLMAAIHKSKRESLGGKSTASPPTSPTVNGDVFTFRTSGNGSPASTIDRKRNGRLSSNGHRNAMSRRSTGATSRDDFKALLLQNACRGSPSTNMSATEKLSLNKPSNSALSRLRPSSTTDAERSASMANKADNGSAEDNGPPELSLTEIRSAITSGSATTSRIGRSNRRGVRPNGTDSKYATLSFHGQKHPPPSSSSKYNTRSRTPTRPMLSIFEDNETEKSPESKPIRSIVDADTDT